MEKLLLFSLTLFLFAGFLIPASFGDLDNPKEQLESGIAPENIACREDLVLVIRTSGDPVCVTEETAEKKGWDIIKTEFEAETTSTAAEMVESETAEMVESETKAVNQDDDKKDFNKNKDTEDIPDTPSNVETVNLTEENINNEDKEPKQIPVNPNGLTGIISQDITFDSVLKMPPKDPDAFAQMLADYTNESILNKKETDGVIKYDTEKGYITIYNYPSILKSSVHYTINDLDLTNQEKLDEFTDGLVDILGINTDEDTTSIKNHPGNFITGKWITQKKDDLTVSNNQIEVAATANQVTIRLGGWNDNLHEMNLIDIDVAKSNAKQVLAQSEELNGPNCNILEKMDSTKFSGKDLLVIEGRPIYSFFYGGCQVQVSPGHSHMYDAYVDAVTGETLFVYMKSFF